MQRVLIYSLILMFVLAVPMAALASNCCTTDKHGAAKSGEASKMKGHTMEGHDAMGHDMHGGGFATIGEQTVKNVKAVAKIIAYDAEKVAMTNATHHIMVYFTDAKSGKAITGGKAALKVQGQDATSRPMMLTLMGEGYGADLRIDKGQYKFEVGSKLEDGQKRQFSYAYTAN